MAIIITDECINCGACEPECPNNAIYEGGVEWSFSDGTSVSGDVVRMDGSSLDADEQNDPIADDLYYIVPDMPCSTVDTLKCEFCSVNLVAFCI